MKTRKELLDIIYDSMVEEKIRYEIAIKNLDDKKDRDVIGTIPIQVQTPLGIVEKEKPITKKDFIASTQTEIKKREKGLETIKKMINEEEAKQSKT